MRVFGHAVKAQFALFVLLGASSTAAPNQQHSLAWELAHGPTEYVPPPVRPVTAPAKIKRVLEAQIKSMLRDPDSAKFEWPYGFRRGTYKSRSGFPSEGWITCGTVNSKNGYGGYVGREAVAAIVSGDSIINVVVDEPTDDGSQWVAYQCDNLDMHVL